MSQTFTARPRRRRHVAAGLATLLLLTAWYTFGAAFDASAATGGALEGRVWDDADRDGRFDAGEPTWSNQGIALYDAAGSYVTGTASGPDGTWRLDGLPVGTYTARMGSYSWQQVRDDWVPTTTTGVFPEAAVEVTSGGTTLFDLGWRPITWSTSLSEPLSTTTSADGIAIEMFNDAMTATQLLEHLDRGTLRGDEATTTTIRFAYSSKTYCGTSVSGSAGSYSNFTATCYVAYGSWLSRADWSLFHEYGHSWSQYHRTVVNQWDSFDPYLQARGIDPNDSRVGSSHAWTPGEMIAEDYRQLFGSPTAAAYAQENQEIPPAHEVDGLEAWLSDTFAGASGGDGSGGSTADTQAPTVSDLLPGDGTTVSDTVTASVQVSDDVSGPNELTVELVLDGTAHAATYSSDLGAWQATLDTTTVADGQWPLEARATDGAGNTATVAHDITVDNGDDGSDTSPEPTSTEDSSGPAISSITVSSVNNGDSWRAVVDVTVTDAGTAVAGTVVPATWSGDGKHGGSGTVSCTTDGSGECRLTVDQPKRVSTVTVTTSAPSVESVLVAKP